MRFAPLVAASFFTILVVSAAAQQGGNPRIPRPNIPQPPRPGVQTPRPGIPAVPRPSIPNIPRPNVPKPNIPTTPSIPKPNVPTTPRIGTTPSIPQPTIPSAQPNIPTTRPDIPDLQPPQHTTPDVQIPGMPELQDVYSCSACNREVGANDTKCPHCGVRFDYVENQDGSRTEIPASPGERAVQIGIGVLVFLGLGAKLFLRR